MFYNAMLAGGTSPAQARVMYYGVRVGGPRWKTVLYTNHPPRAFPQPGDRDEYRATSWVPSFDKAETDADIARLEREELSLDEIDALADNASSGVEPNDVIRTDLQR